MKGWLNCNLTGDHHSVLLTLYRGTGHREEQRLWSESDGYIYSDAARDGYYGYINDGYAFTPALNAGVRHSASVLVEQTWIWGGVEDYCRAHTEFGTDLSREFGPRPLTSWTTDITVARAFAGENGHVYETRVPMAQVVSPPNHNTAEAEVLLANSVYAKRVVFPQKKRK